MADLTCKIGNIAFPNPILTASGTFGYGDELEGFLDTTRLGGVVTKSLSFEPRLGNPPPRTCETASGMLNSIGLANIGVRRFIKEKLPVYADLGTKVVVSIAGSTTQEYCDIIHEIEEAHGAVDGYEINISCPNTDEGGLTFGTSAQLSHEVISRIRPLTRKTVIAKLTPNVAKVGEVAAAVEDAGADAVSLINTLVGMAIDVRRRTPKLGGIKGGLSGPCIKPVAIAQVFDVAKCVKIPIVGIGGIETAEDVLEFLLAGATAVQVGTSCFYNPAGLLRIIEDLNSFCDEQNIARLREIRGTVRTQDQMSISMEK